ncbi:MAG: DUF1295 domain-containing protein [Sandaracinaceae bacterium]
MTALEPGELSILLPNLLFCATIAFACWVLSLLTKEHGWIDRVWSLAPALFAGWFAIASFHPRALIMATLVFLWCARLTWNFARKGGYRLGGEDYRWGVVRETMNGWQWALFNIVWICIVQNAILLGMVLPMWATTRYWGAEDLGLLDAVATVLFLLFLVGETIADQQQWRFQEAKRIRRENGEPIERGFLDDGLFRFSRHPNFFCEMGMWWSFYLFSIAAGAPILNITILGALILTAQFQGSTSMTEKLSLEKYPDYAEYQKRTSRILPWFPGKPSR